MPSSNRKIEWEDFTDWMQKVPLRLWVMGLGCLQKAHTPIFDGSFYSTKTKIRINTYHCNRCKRRGFANA